MELHLAAKRVLVTGGNSGLGAAMAKAFAKASSRVAINFVEEPEAAERMAAGFCESGGEALAIRADVSDAAEVASMFERLDREWSGIDVLIANAGIDGVPALGWEAEVADWIKVIQVNLVGAWLCARQALQRMVPQGSGVILATSSVHEVIPWSRHSAYVASKAGLSGMVKSLAQEAAPFGVRVLSIAPGAIRTPINEDVWGDPEGREDLLDKIPLGRIGTPEDIAGMALVLASDVAGYVTGTTVFVDGGMTTYPAFSHGG